MTSTARLSLLCGLIALHAQLASAEPPARRAPVAPVAPAPAVRGAAPIPSADEQARSLFEQGRDAYANADYERALDLFKQSYALSGKVELLNNIGAAADRLRRDREALDAYKRYLEAKPDAQNRTAIENRIAVLEAAVNAPAPAAPTPAETARAATPPPAAAPAPATAPKRDEGSGGSVLGRWWFWTGVAAVAIAGAAIGIGLSSSEEDVPGEPPVVDKRTRVIEL